MGLYYERLRALELKRAPAHAAPRPTLARGSSEARAILLRRWHPRPYQVVSVSSNKGGVGKTTLAANLAVYLRTLREDLPILVFGLDDQSLLDRMFARENVEPAETVASALRAGSFATALRRGRFGVHYVPSDPCVSVLKDELGGVLGLHDALDRTGWRGLVVIDTKSDLELLTRNALAASDLILVPVGDETALREGAKVFELLDRWKLPRQHARVVLSMLDLRMRYHEGATSVHEFLRSELERRALPSLQGFLSYSPKVHSLGSDAGRAVPIVQGAPRSLVARQMRGLALEVLALLGGALDAPSHIAPCAAAAPANLAKRFLLRRRAHRPWRDGDLPERSALERLIGEIHSARAS